MSTAPYSIVKASFSAALDRASAGGGRLVPLPPISVAGDQGQGGSGWFGPLQPMAPVAPSEVSGRRNDYPSGFNLTLGPRPYEPVTYHELRMLADGYDLLRLVIETRKDQMARLPWTIGPRDEKLRIEKGSPLAKRVDSLVSVFRRPDKDNFWGSWLRSILEDLLVIDAPAIHIRRTRGGDIYSLDQLDGATIKRVIDNFGRTPEPPYAAYQQVLKGLPAVNYSKTDLLFRPRNMRVHKFYGFSPVEQVMMTVNIALRRQLWQLAYFTDGNIPDSLIGVPSTWTPDQIRQFQDWFDSLLQGNSRTRRGARFVPGEVAKSYVPTKEAEIFGAAEEWLARVVCFCFGVSHQALVKEVNRATAATAQQQALQDGLAPIMSWVKELIDTILIDFYDELELEFKWVDDKEIDAKTQSEVIDVQVKGGLITRNEGRETLGREPDNSPEANMLTITTANGIVPLSQAEQIKQKKEMVAAFPVPDPSTVPQKPGQQGSAVGGSAGGKDGGAAGNPTGKVATPSTAHKSAPADKTPVTVTRPEVEKVRLRVGKKITRAFTSAQSKVEKQVSDFLKTKKVAKGDPSHGDGLSNDERSSIVVTSEEVDSLIDNLDLSDLENLDLGMDFSEVAEDAVDKALAMVGATDRQALVDQVNDRATDYSRQKAANLVGKRVLADGSIIDNPNEDWAITESTREMIRDLITKSLGENLGSDAIIQALEEDFAFSPARADTVSRTELADVNSQAAMESYRGAKADGIAVQKEWILGENPCPVCEENADEGPIELEEDFPSGDDTSPAHPLCECAVVPVLGEGEEE